MSQQNDSPDSARSPDQVDKYVGKRIRMRRCLLGLSQENLAQAVSLTFQQIQKYERGTNRVSAGRLYQFSQILTVPISYFYDGYNCDSPAYGLSDTPQEQIASGDVFESKESLEVLKLYYSVSKDPKSRKEFLKLIRTMADNWSG